MKRLVSICVAVTVFFTASAWATMPVIDLASIAQMIEMVNRANTQIKELNNLNSINKNQYGFLQKNLNGNYGYGNFMNDKPSLYRRQWSNDNWTDVLKASSSGHASSFSNAQRKYDELYPVRDASAILTTRSESNLQRTHYKQSHEISRAALAASQYSYDQLNEHIKNLHEMLGTLEKEKTEKAAMDMNARLVAEIGFIQLEMLRQQNIQTQLLATQMQGDVNGMSDQAQFMQWQH